jgi:RNA polymerase sigma-70 factor (ECF subfamily)
MDTNIVRSAQRGDEQAFAIIAEAVLERFLGVAHRILRDIPLAEDATQQALLHVWRDLGDLRDPAKFEAWAYRLLVRACYTEARKRRRWHPDLLPVSKDEPTAPEGMTTVLERDQLERGLQRLSVDHRAVLVLYYYADLPLDEVAVALGVPVGTVKSRLHRAHQALRGALEADDRHTAAPYPLEATR